MKYVLAIFGLVLAVLFVADQLRSDSDDGGGGASTTRQGNQKTTFIRKDNTKKATPSKAPDRIRETVVSILEDVITGAVSLDDRAKLEDRAIAAMEIEEQGTEDARITTAVWLIDAISKQIEMAGLLVAKISTELTPMQSAAVRELARQFTSDVKNRLAAGAEGHEGAFMAAVEFTVPEGHSKVHWNTIGGFEYTEGMTLPEGALALHEKSVGIAGYMMSLGQYADVHKFLLVESIWSCCFGIPPDVHQVVVVTIPDDKPGIELTSMPVMILGKFDVGEEKDGRWVTSVYRLTSTEVKEID